MISNEKWTYVIDPSRISIISFVEYFLAKSNAEKLFTARRLINNPSNNNNSSQHVFILHMDMHINGVTRVRTCWQLHFSGYWLRNVINDWKSSIKPWTKQRPSRSFKYRSVGLRSCTYGKDPRIDVIIDARKYYEWWMNLFTRFADNWWWDSMTERWLFSERTPMI